MKTIMKTDMRLTNGKVYFIYARKSSEDRRQIASIPDQLKICHRLEQELNIKVPEEYIFTDTKSAMKAHKRENFNQMKQLMAQAVNKKISITIITWNPNRLARNGEEGGYICDRVRDGELEICTDTAGWFTEQNYDRTYEKLKDAVIYSKETSIGILRRFKEKAEMGICPTAAHLGYRFNPTKEKGEKDIIKEINWDKCREWVELFLTGQYTVEQSLEIMTARGLIANPTKKHPNRPVSPSKAYYFFRDIYNTGLFDYRGKRYEGIHPPLMAMAEYKRIQSILDNRGGKNDRDNPLPLMGLFKCGCGCGSMVTGEKHTRHYLNGNSQDFNYYRSSKKKGDCQEKAVSEKEIETQVMNYINSIEQVPEFLEWLKKVIKRQNQVMYQREIKEQELQSKKLAEITRRKYELRDMKNEGFFPHEGDYKKELDKLLQEEMIVRQEVATTNDSVWESLFEDLCNFALRVRELYESDNPFVKRAVVEIIGLNFNLKDKKLKIKAKDAFIMLYLVKKQLWEKNLWIEPQENKQIEAKSDPLKATSSCSLLLCAEDRT